MVGWVAVHYTFEDGHRPAGFSSKALVATGQESWSSLGLVLLEPLLDSWPGSRRDSDVYGTDGVSNIMAVWSLLGSNLGRVIANNKTFIHPDDAKVRSANAVASKGTLMLELEKVIHRTTAIGNT